MSCSLTLFAAFHKPYPVPAAAYIVPIHGGKALSNTHLGFPGDDTGDHISTRNPSFSEITVLYWVWKNVPRTGITYWGLVHYRRLFCLDERWKKKDFYDYTKAGTNIDALLTPQLQQRICRSLKKNDVVLPRPVALLKQEGTLKSIEDHYAFEHIAAHWQEMLLVIRDLYPDYLPSLHFFKTTKLSLFNMMIAGWPVWDAYLEWLFAILFELERRLPQIDDAYQQRVYGFLAERLLNLFIHHQQYKIAYYPVAVFA